MIEDTSIFHAVIVGSFFALGIALEHLRIKLAMRRKRQARRQFLGMSSRRDPEPVWGNWTAEIGRAIGGRK